MRITSTISIFFFVLAVPMILPGVCNYGFDLHVSFH